MSPLAQGRRPLLGGECRRAVGVGNELDLAATLAERGLRPGDRDAIRRAVDDAGEWAHDLGGRIGVDERAPSARERGEISDPRLVLRGQMLDNMRRRRPGQQ